MVSNGRCCGLRTLSIAAALIGALGACAAPSADERAKFLDLRYGKVCSALAPGLDSPKYRECVIDAYANDRKRLISEYNVDIGRTGMAPLLLIH